MIGEKLVKAGVISEAQLQEALAKQKESDKRLGEIIVELGFATSAAVEAALG